ncbi:MAG TPA: hypothetical protein VGR74_09650 [Actinomycetota bacterium]|nr:hypothetical protein [Actinomycetota bacterium]
MGAVASQGAELARRLGAGEEDLGGLGGAAGQVEDGGQVGVGPTQVVDVGQLHGDAAALLQLGDALLHVPEDAQGHAQAREGVALHGPRADPPGHGDRLLAPDPRLGMAAQHLEELAMGGQGAGQLLRWRLGGDHGHRPLDGGHRPGVSPAV